jgi:Uma2 family endonuclease
LPKPPVKVPEFLAWAGAQADGRYELVDGVVVAMAPDNVRHNLVKLAVARALGDAIRAGGLPCFVFTDGVGVIIDDSLMRVPDASVQCGLTPKLDAATIEAPLIVVEVVSPSSVRRDGHEKLIEYFSVPSIHHYLIVFAEKRVVVHHQRNAAAIATRILHDGDILLDPPGMTVAVASLLGPS